MDESSEIETKPLEFEMPSEIDDKAGINPSEKNASPTNEPKTAQDTANQMDRGEILSRRKQKKLLKLAKWEENKKLKRQKEREKRKERRAQEVQLGLPGATSKRKKLKQNKIDDSPNLVSVAIDFDYDELMEDKDIGKCAKQMLRVYTENRKSQMPIKLHFTSIKENGRIEKSLSRNDGYKNWDVKIHQNSYLEIFDHKQIVYLTSDSDNVLNELEPHIVYIIGGLVDHNHQKGLTLKRAQEKGLRTARLPLSEHIEMKTRSVLTIVHGMKYFFRFCHYLYSFRC